MLEQLLLSLLACGSAAFDSEQHATVLKSIEASGGRIEREGGRETGPVVEVNLNGRDLTLVDFEQLASLSNIESLSLGRTQFKDHDLRHVGRMIKLKSVNLASTKIGHTRAGPASMRRVLGDNIRVASVTALAVIVRELMIR